MYSYTYDKKTGGIILSSSPQAFSKEPRPVYYQELDMLGFDRFWKYEKNDSAPYMWAEANDYIYRGRKVATVKGGSISCKPELIIHEEPEKNNRPLKFVDIPAMIYKNKSIMNNLAQESVKDVYNIYNKYKNKIDVFYVAFSGGKDSIVTLDIVQRALPHNDFKVLFGDTGMEFPDTYDTVDKVEGLCKDLNIDFIRARSEYSPDYTWSKFGPPATVTRWCCSVHKTAPQIITLRNILNKNNFTGLAFIGVRASESSSRSGYDYISLGEKHRGQYSCNPILEWNSAELYIYIFMQSLIQNMAYHKGNRRAGCLLCPRATERNEYTSRVCYPNEFNNLLDKIKTPYIQNFASVEKLKEFINNGGWKARKNGRDLSITVGYQELESGSNTILKISNPRTDWKEWIKTIGILSGVGPSYTIFHLDKSYSFNVNVTSEGYDVVFSSLISKENANFIKLLKNIFRKSASCIMCRVCEADCHKGCINMNDGHFSISNDCVHCSRCHKVEKGCLVYKSLEIPKGNTNMIKNKSLNCYSHHAPKREWIDQFFELKNTFDQNHTLGSQMFNFFKRFLKDSLLRDNKGKITPLVDIVANMGLDNPTGWAILFVNLSYTPQINWLVTKTSFNETYNKDYILSLLVSDGAKEDWVNDIWSAFSRLMELPFNLTGMGLPIKEKNRFVGFTRYSWQNPDAKVILYSLYKFAEACGDYYQFSLARLMDSAIDSDGVSPSSIFGLDRETMVALLKGLAINYPDYISVAFTLDLDNINLRHDKKSVDILELF